MRHWHILDKDGDSVGSTWGYATPAPAKDYPARMELTLGDEVTGYAWYGVREIK